MSFESISRSPRSRLIVFFLVRSKNGRIVIKWVPIQAVEIWTMQGKVGGSEMEFGAVDVHALDSGENTVAKNMHIFFGFKSVIRLGWAGLVITKTFWEKLVAVKWSLVRSMYMLLTRVKIQCVFFGISNAFYEHLHVKICNTIPENTPCLQHSHSVKCLDIARRKHYQAKNMHIIF